MTGTPLSVAAPGVEDSLSGLHGVIASLQRSLAWAADAPDLVAIDGREGWVERAAAALGAGVRGMMIIDPDVADPAAIRGFASAAAAAGAAVEVDARWASDPAVEQLVSLLGAEGPPGLLDVDLVLRRAERPGFRRRFVGLISTIAEFVGPLGRVDSAAADVGGLTWIGATRSGWTVVGAAVFSAAGPDGIALRLYGHDPSAEILIGGPESARAAVTRVSHAEGELLPDVLYESAHRASWKRLVAACRGEPTRTPLETLAATLEGAAELIPIAEEVAVRTAQKEVAR